MKQPCYQDCLGTPILPSYVINIRVFSLLCQDTNMPGSNFVKKMLQLFNYKLALYQTQKGGPNYQIINSFLLFCSELPTKLELSNTIGPGSCVVHVLCGFSSECLKASREFSLLLYWHGNISITTYSTSFHRHRVNNSTVSFTNITIALKGESP